MNSIKNLIFLQIIQFQCLLIHYQHQYKLTFSTNYPVWMSITTLSTSLNTYHFYKVSSSNVYYIYNAVRWTCPPKHCLAVWIKIQPHLINNTLTLAYLSWEFAFCAHFQYVVRRYNLKSIENANQLVSTQGKIHENSNVLGRISALTNQNCLFRKKSILKCVDSLIGKSDLNVTLPQYYFLPQWFICY